MRLTKFTHSCVRLDDGPRSLLFDPGVFGADEEFADAFDGVEAVLITHEHPDHTDVDRVGAALERDPRLRLFTPAPVAAQFGERAGQVVTVAAGERFEAAGFAVRAFGGQHALIHPSIPVVANVGYLVDEGGAGVYHPGDSFTVPDAEVRTALLPINAPWSKVGELIDFAVALRARRAHQIHDGLVNDRWFGIVEGHVARIAGPFGVGFEHLAPGATVTA